MMMDDDDDDDVCMYVFVFHEWLALASDFTIKRFVFLFIDDDG